MMTLLLSGWANINHKNNHLLQDGLVHFDGLLMENATCQELAWLSRLDNNSYHNQPQKDLVGWIDRKCKVLKFHKSYKISIPNWTFGKRWNSAIESPSSSCGWHDLFRKSRPVRVASVSNCAIPSVLQVNRAYYWHFWHRNPFPAKQTRFSY